MDSETRARTVDELDQEAEQGKKGKKTKPPKPPKTKAPKKPKPEKKPKPVKKPKPPKRPKPGAPSVSASSGEGEEAREKRRHPVRTALLLTSLFWVLLIGAVVAVCCLRITNEFGDKQYILDPEGVVRGPILLFLNPDEESREDYYRAEQDYYTDWEKELEEFSNELDAREAELDARSDELDAREYELDDREDEALSSEESPTVTVGGATSEDISRLAKSLQEMTPLNAANAIAEMSDETTLIGILRKVKPASLGKILDAMEADYAAYIVELLAQPPEEE